MMREATYAPRGGAPAPSSKWGIEKKNFRRSASATLLCVCMERRKVSLATVKTILDFGGLEQITQTTFLFRQT